MSTHHIISLDTAVAGMTLADNLLDSHGKTLLLAGIVLTEGMLTSLRRHQISTLSVVQEGDTEPDAAEAQDKALKLAQRMKRVDQIFKANEREPLNQQLKHDLVHYLTEDKT